MGPIGRRRGLAGSTTLAATAVALMQIIFLAPPTSAQQSNGTSRVVPAEGYCSMYGICAHRSDGRVLNCVNATKAVKPDTLFSTRIQSLCPTITGDVCCTVDQFDTLHQQVQQAIPFLVGCPACLRNLLNLFCEMSCSPNQSFFINVTSVKQVNNTITVDGIDYYLTSNYGEELYNSCKDVKFGTLNTRAMDFLGGGAKTYKEWLAFIGHQANPNEPGSPYLITFRSDFGDSSGVKPLNATVYSCGDPSLGCSCGDCPSSSVCMGSLLPQLNTETSCSVKMGSLKSEVFAVAFAVLAAGAIILTLNVLLLGGHIIFFQSLSLLGYCLFPLDVGALVCMLKDSVILKIIMVTVTLAWSSWAAYPFMSAAVNPRRKALALYPVFLMYISVGFLIIAID